MKKRWIAKALMMTVLVTALSGCGEAKENNAENTEVQTEQTAQVTEPESSEEPVAQAQENAQENATEAAAENTTENGAAESTTEETESGAVDTETQDTEASGEGAAEDGKEEDAATEADAGEEAAEDNQTAAAGVSAQEIYDKITAAVTLPEMFLADALYVSNYFGVDTSIFDSYVFAVSMDPVKADAVIIMQLKDASDVQAAEGYLNIVIAQMGAEMQDYLPDQYALVSQASVKHSGNYAYLVIGENASTIEGIIQESIGQ